MTASPSPELAAIAKRYMRALFSADGETVRNFLSAQDPLLFCGSAYGEIWEGNVLRDGFAGHVSEFPQTTVRNERVHAYENGNTGWALWTGICQLSLLEGEIEAHHSFVFTLEKGQWRVQFIHNSIAISNPDVLGYEHTSIASLLEALERDQNTFTPSGSVTLMFTDIVQSTALAAALGDSRWADIIRAHLALVTDCVTECGGAVVKSLGDGTMSHFPSAGAALRAARTLQHKLSETTEEPRLSIRAGVHTGDAIAADGDFFGTVVNTAARVAESAGAGEIRVSEATRLMVGAAHEFTFSEAALFPLKGLEGRHHLHLLEWRT